jgi:hypothetical protein
MRNARNIYKSMCLTISSGSSSKENILGLAWEHYPTRGELGGTKMLHSPNGRFAKAPYGLLHLRRYAACGNSTGYEHV